jgi:hypothetical protein
MVCLSCELVCRERMKRRFARAVTPSVTARKKNPYSRSMALLLAAGLMYLPANIYPIATIPDRPEAHLLYGARRRHRSGPIASARFGGAGIHREFHHSFAKNARIGVVRFFGDVRLVSIPRRKDPRLSRRGGNRAMVHGGSS